VECHSCDQGYHAEPGDLCVAIRMRYRPTDVRFWIEGVYMGAYFRARWHVY